MTRRQVVSLFKELVNLGKYQEATDLFIMYYRKLSSVKSVVTKLCNCLTEQSRDDLADIMYELDYLPDIDMMVRIMKRHKVGSMFADPYFCNVENAKKLLDHYKYPDYYMHLSLIKNFMSVEILHEFMIRRISLLIKVEYRYGDLKHIDQWTLLAAMMYSMILSCLSVQDYDIAISGEEIEIQIWPEGGAFTRNEHHYLSREYTGKIYLDTTNKHYIHGIQSNVVIMDHDRCFAKEFIRLKALGILGYYSGMGMMCTCHAITESTRNPSRQSHSVMMTTSRGRSTKSARKLNN